MPRPILIAFFFAVSVSSGCQQADADKPPAPEATGDAVTPTATDTERTTDRASGVDVRPQKIVVGDWPRFLGPHGTGISDETGLADEWPAEGPPVVWSKEIGVGYSAPSVLGDRLVVHHRRRDQEIIECLEAATGDSLWQHATATDFVDPYGYNGGPRCSPLLTTDRCYTFGAGGTLCCLDLATGQEIWTRETTDDFDIPEAFFGIGASPILAGNRLIVFVGGQPDSGVVAFDTATGDVAWHAVGKSTWDGAVQPDGDKYEWTGEEMLVSYASPVVARFDGEDHLLCLVRQGLVSLDPANGRERFHYWFRSRVHESVNAAQPVVAGDTVLLTAAYRTGAALLKIDGDGFKELWRDRSNLECHWSTPIVADGYAYAFSGRHESQAMLRCVELETGEIVWEADGSESVRDEIEPDRFGRGYVRTSDREAVPWPYFGRGSKITADGKWILLGERGTLFLADLTPEGYRERSRCAAPGIRYPAWAAPVLSRGRLYLRDEDTLVCLDVSRGGEVERETAGK